MLKKYSFKTLSYPFITELRNIWYPNGKKIIPSNLGDFLNPRVLAIWYKEDGNVNYLSNGAITTFNLAINCFTMEENQFLCKLLKDKFNLNCTIYINKNTPFIYILANSREDFLNLVRPYIIPHFNYKISPRPEGFIIQDKDGIKVSCFDINGNEIEGSPFPSFRAAGRATS